MLFLYKTADGAFATLASSTLQREGIENHSFELGTSLSGYGKLDHPSEHHIYLLNDGDFDRAKKLLLALGADDPKPVELPSRQATHWIIFLSLLVSVAL